MKTSAMAIGSECPKITAVKSDRFVDSLMGYVPNSPLVGPQDMRRNLLFQTLETSAPYRSALETGDLKMTMAVSSGKYSQQDCCISTAAFERSRSCSHFKCNQSQCMKV